jgi:hypothetical protein
MAYGSGPIVSDITPATEGGFIRHSALILLGILEWIAGIYLGVGGALTFCGCWRWSGRRRPASPIP